MDLEVTSAALAAMRAAAAAAHPREACGILLGEGGRIAEARETANVHPAPHRHFEIDPRALIEAHRAAREGAGDEVLGYFHSHPVGAPIPSATDRASAAHDGRIWAIIAGGDVRLWRDDKDGFRALSYAAVPA
jgi:proteasome lid subunit RPN8/RPN11